MIPLTCNSGSLRGRCEKGELRTGNQYVWKMREDRGKLLVSFLFTSLSDKFHLVVLVSFERELERGKRPKLCK